MTPNEDTRGPGRGGCAECGAALSGDQRYCVECGTRRGELPPAVAGIVTPLLERDRGLRVAESPPAEVEPVEAEAATGGAGAFAFMPSPRAAAVVVMGMLAFGVVIGSATSQLAQSAGLSTIVLDLTEPAPAEEPAEEVEEEAETETAYEPEATEAATTSGAEEEPAAEEEPTPEAPEENPVPFDPTEEFEAELPEVKHVFMIVLGENGYEETFGPTATAPYLSKTLPEQGELIPNYYAVTKGELANQIALLSGQGPTVETAANCPNYTDIVPGTESATGQVEGGGCVYPTATATLPGQLVEAKKKWKAYVEDIGNGAATGQPTTCRHPALGGPDPSQAPVPGDSYVTWHNPLVYFHSVIDSAECATADVGLDRLTTDLTKKVNKQTPALSYIVPSVCHDGTETPCEPGRLAGPIAAEEFLKAVIPEITSSAAYKENGMIAITSAQARQTGEAPDTSSCCISPVYPNLPPAPETETETGLVKATGGGGKVGLLLISPFVEPGSVNETVTYNHYSLLLTIEELFGLEKLGYASEPALLPFDESVFNAGAEEESTVAKRAGWFGRSGWLSRAGSAAR